MRAMRLVTLVSAVLGLCAGHAGAQTSGWIFGRVAGLGSPAPPAPGRGLFASFSAPVTTPDGPVVFRGEVAGAATAFCSGTCRGLYRATPAVDCSVFLQPRRIYPTVEPIILQGEPAPVDVYRDFDDAPSVAVPPIFHTSCYGTTSTPFEGVFEGQTQIEGAPSAGLPCGSLFSSPRHGLLGAVYWRALFEAIAFWRFADQSLIDLVLPLAPTNTRLGGHFLNLAKARSDDWELLERGVAMSESNHVAFLAEVAGIDTDPGCLGLEAPPGSTTTTTTTLPGTEPSICDAAFFLDIPSGVVMAAAARNDALAGGGTIARFCGPPAVAEGGLVVFRALASDTGDCDPVSGTGQGIYAITAPFVPGAAVTVADVTVVLPDGQNGTFTADVFSNPIVSRSGSVVFRAGPPGAGGGMAAIIRSVPPFGPTDLVGVASKGASNPEAGLFTSFDPAPPATNSREEVAFLAAEGIWVASPTPIVLQECADVIALCRGTIFAAAARLVSSEGRAGQLCFRKIIKGKIPDIDCWTQDRTVTAKVARLRASIARGIRFACNDYLIPIVGACDRAQPTVQGEIDCLINTHEPRIGAIFDALIPG